MNRANATATATALAPRSGAIKPERAITAEEAWAMVTELRVSLEFWRGQFIATFRNDERGICLPVPGPTAFDAIVALLEQLGVEVAHG